MLPTQEQASMQAIHPVHAFLVGVALAAVLAVGLAGCRGFSLPHRPHAPAGGIALQPDGPLQGMVDTGDLTVAYAYAVTFEPGRRLHLSGGVRSVRTRADSVTVYLHLLDSAGRVIDRSVLYASGYKPSSYIRRPSTWDISLALPPEAAAMAFSAHVQPSAGRR